MPLPDLDLSEAPSPLLHSIVGWLYSECFPSVLLLDKPRFFYDDDFEEVPLDMDATYDDAWLFSYISNDVITSITSYRGFAARGVYPYRLFPWAHDHVSLTRIVPTTRRRSLVSGQGTLAVED